MNSLCVCGVRGGSQVSLCLSDPIYQVSKGNISKIILKIFRNRHAIKKRTEPNGTGMSGEKPSIFWKSREGKRKRENVINNGEMMLRENKH